MTNFTDSAQSKQIDQAEHNSDAAAKRVILRYQDPDTGDWLSFIPNKTSGTDEYDLIQDDDTSSPSYEYYGYMKSGGGWYIKRITLSTTLREYVKGTSGYTTAWTNRASQTFADYGSIF